MPAKSIELRKERAKLLHDARQIVEVAEGEKRSMRADENENYDKLMSAMDDMEKRIEALEKVESREDDMAESKSKRDDDEARDDADSEDRDDGDDEERDDDEQCSKRHRSVWDRPEKRNGRKPADAQYRRGFKQWLVSGKHTAEFRDAVLGTDSAGGYFALPTELSKQMIISLNNLTFFRELCTIEQVTNAASLGVRQMTTQPSDASWTGEITQVTPDSAMTLNRRDLYPQIFTKLVNISIRLLQAAPDAESIVLDRLTYKIAVASENAFLNGSGSGQPLGVFTASSNGIPTSQDIVSSVSLSKLFTADDLISVLYNIPQQYQNSDKFAWIMHRSVVSVVRKMKDSLGQYLLQTGIAANRGDLVLGYQLKQSEYAPALNSNGTGTASQYAAVLGDFRFYTWAEVVPPAVQRLVERFADYNEIGYLERYFADGSPVLAPAFTRLQLAAS